MHLPCRVEWKWIFRWSNFMGALRYGGGGGGAGGAGIDGSYANGGGGMVEMARAPASQALPHFMAAEVAALLGGGNAGVGGLGGGGHGGVDDISKDGAPNTGGGGGGGNNVYGKGGSGVVIVRYKHLTSCVNQEQQCGTDYYHDGSDCVKCPAGTTRQPGAANKCTPSGSGNVDKDNSGSSGNSPAPAPAESKKRQAEERAKKMNAGITDPMQKKKLTCSPPPPSAATR